MNRKKNKINNNYQKSPLAKKIKVRKIVLKQKVPTITLKKLGS